MKTQYNAKLIDKVLLSSRSDIHLLRLELSHCQSFAYAPGQFISVVLTSDYPPDHPRAGQPHFENKAYTLASRGSGHMLELVLNRAGSFSSRLLDRRVGDPIVAALCRRVKNASESVARENGK